ncbi:MAG: 2-C-methyl-D-erythritol 2,4-cyclodiphosphate synthase [Acidiferrobacteraceae bacterium]
MIRVGHGYDVHALVAERRLVLGGVEIPHRLGLAGHSDADVLIHAVCDALFGAAGQGDIGRHFPDSDPQYAGIESRILLRKTGELLRQQGWRVGNLDATIIAQAPRLAPYIGTMCANLAADLQVDPAMVNVKATTTEKLGFIGREQGIAVESVVLIERD